MSETFFGSIAAWNQLVKKYGPVSGRFLHTAEWELFQNALHEKTARIIFGEREHPTGYALVIEKTLDRVGSYTYLPRGPVFFDRKNISIADAFSKEPYLFIRFEPEKIFPSRHVVKTVDIQPAVTWLTDLSQSADELLAGMHPKTRYNIRLAQKKGVQIMQHEKMTDEIWNLFSETAARGAFRLHSRSHYEMLLSTLSDDEVSARLSVATLDNRALAAVITVDFDGIRTYLHGASSQRDRQLMAPYLLHWQLVRDAQEKNMRLYDWWGVAPASAPAFHPWAGISRFKRGFGGKEVSYPGTFDFILKPFHYQAYQIARTFHRRFF